MFLRVTLERYNVRSQVDRGRILERFPSNLTYRIYYYELKFICHVRWYMGRFPPMGKISQWRLKYLIVFVVERLKGNKTDFVEIFHVVPLILFSIASRRSQVYYIFIFHVALVL